MNDTMQNNIYEQPNPKDIFCHKCGHRLLEDSKYCSNCGTTVEYTADNLYVDSLEIQDVEQNTVKPQKQRNKKKRLIGIVLGVFILAIIIVSVFCMTKLIVKPQNIDNIDGCPEFYELKWGMPTNVADQKIELKHTLLETSDLIIIDDDEEFNLYGKHSEDVFISFDNNSLNSVIITFSKEKYSLDEIVALYTKIYGQASESETLYFSWNGSKTTINIYDYEATSDNGENTIVVIYSIPKNIAFSSLTFNGDELDPCGFLTSNYAFDKKPDYYIKGLKKGEDYDVDEFSPGGEFSGFSQYTLYPSFKYMGIDNGMTAIEFNKDENEEYIGLVSYKFLLDEENATDRISHIHSKLMGKYGTPNDISYTSTYYAKMGIKNLTFEKMMEQISENTEGIYHIQWKQGKRNITLGLTISVDKEYYEGSVSYSN